MKTIIVTRSSEKPIEIASPFFVENTYTTHNFNAYIYKRLLLDCILALDLDDGETTEEVVARFKQIYNIPSHDLLSEEVFEEFEFEEAVDYICNNKELESLLLEWSKDPAKTIVKQPYYTLPANDGADEIILVDYQFVRDNFVSMSSNLKISSLLRSDLIMAICMDCNVPKDGANILYIHDKEWGQDLEQIECKEILVDGEGDLPKNVLYLKEFFNYVAAFIHRSNKVYNKVLDTILEK
jgi:hypothetical protein